MAYNQQLSVLGQVAPATTGTAGQVLVSAGNSASSYWASAIPVSAYSAQFNGSSSYLTVPSNAAFQFGSNDFTIEAWIYTFSATNQFITTEHNYGYTGSHYFWINASGYVSFTAFTSVSSYTASTSAITTNTWNHVSCGRTGSTIWVSLNGVRTTTSVSGVVSNPAQPFNIGRQTNGSLFFNGYISNLRVINGLAVYTGNFTPPTSPLGTAQAAGTNITAVTPSQVGLLTCNGPGFTDSSPTAFALTNNGAIASQFAPFSSFSAISRSATQTQTILTSGSGTYYPPSGVAWLRIRMVGGGGGGIGTSGDASNGTNTTFGTSLLTAGFGYGSLASNRNTPGAGGTASIGTGATGIALPGGGGGIGPYSAYAGGGTGGSSPFGGAGTGGFPDAAAHAGFAAATNSGSGGGGGNYGTSGAASAGAGGGAGGYVEAYISSPAASYAYTVGAAGAGGAGSSPGGAGGAGGSGIIIVEENYAVSVVKKSMTQTILTSGSGTYTTPIGVVQLEIRMVGGGGGGGGGAFGTVGSNGGSTTFGTSLLTATGGIGADRGSVAMSVGGTGTISGATGVTLSGGSGTPGAYGNSIYYPQAGNGGNTPFGGGGGGSSPTGGALFAGVAGATNSGAGGAGGHSTSYNWAGHGGGGAGYVEAYISSPAASYAYAVGAGGGGGAAAGAGSSNGGGGGSGIIIIKEYY